MSERKDIDAIVGATVKLEESLNTRISELEKKVEKYGINSEFWKSSIVSITDTTESSIAELKEEMKIFKGAVINYNHDYDRIRQVREVLREISDFEYRKYIGEQVDVGGFWQYIEQKLDGKKGDSETIIISDEELEQRKAFIFPQKDLGGDYTGMIYGEDQIAMEQEQGEKPPEPSFICKRCGTEIFLVDNYSKKRKYCNLCKSILEHKEPSEKPLEPKRKITTRTYKKGKESIGMVINERVEPSENDRIRCLSFNHSRTNNYGNCVSNGFLPKEYGKISEFLNDFQWYLAFELHYSWIEFYPRKCICKTNPIAFKNWIIEKWEAMLK